MLRHSRASGIKRYVASRARLITCIYFWIEDAVPERSKSTEPGN